MQTTSYKEKLLKEIDKIPANRIETVYKIIHLLTAEITSETNKDAERASLRGIWKGSLIDDSIFSDAKKSLFPYENKQAS